MSKSEVWCRCGHVMGTHDRDGCFHGWFLDQRMPIEGVACMCLQTEMQVFLAPPPDPQEADAAAVLRAYGSAMAAVDVFDDPQASSRMRALFETAGFDIEGCIDRMIDVLLRSQSLE